MGPAGRFCVRAPARPDTRKRADALSPLTKKQHAFSGATDDGALGKENSP